MQSFWSWAMRKVQFMRRIIQRILGIMLLAWKAKGRRFDTLKQVANMDKTSRYSFDTCDTLFHGVGKDVAM